MEQYFGFSTPNALRLSLPFNHSTGSFCPLISLSLGSSGARLGLQARASLQASPFSGALRGGVAGDARIYPAPHCQFM